jgi:hypothetical protein
VVALGNEEQRQVQKYQLSPEDRILANAVQFLIDGHEEDAANVLLSCSLTITETDRTQWSNGDLCKELTITLVGPRAAYDILYYGGEPTPQAIRYALNAVLPPLTCVGSIVPRAERMDIDANWRAQMLEIARGKGVHNQGCEINSGQMFTWNGLRFRSLSEVHIAQSLQRAGLLFLPNCMARLRGPDGPENKEADFLVCCNGTWGLLEVDGEPFHPPSRVAWDHARDRLFRGHGIKVVEHFDATECYRDPDGVVVRFLEILRKASS